MKYIIGLIIIALVAAGAFVVAGRDDNQNNKEPSQQTESNNQSTDATSSNSQAAASTDKVSISNFAFSPTDITVKKGTKVTWTNNDSLAHTVTVDSGDGPKSETLDNGATYSFTFSQTGTFNYHCDLHPSMHGTVTVTE